jgi:hypothetical protein
MHEASLDRSVRVIYEEYQPSGTSGTPSQARAGDRSPRSWSKRAGIGVRGSNAGLRRVSVIRHIVGR